MIVTVGTFNLNNLFSRFNFSSAIDEIQKTGSADAVTIQYEFTDLENIRIRTFMGKLVKAKDEPESAAIAKRIKAMGATGVQGVDVLAVQEVENIHILKDFNKTFLGNLYPHQVLIEGNDSRFIDVGLLSKLPLGAITSYQAVTHSDNPNKTVFSRDLLEVEVLNSTRSKKLFTIYNNHLKSHFGDEDNNGQGKVSSDIRRTQQAEKIAEIVSSRMRPNSKFIITGDMNDPPTAAPLQPMLTIDGNNLFNALQNPQETRPAKPESGGNDPQTTAWTHRFKKSGQPPDHKLFDQIWLSQRLASTFKGSFIERRTKHGGNGSDHDPAWVELDI